MPLVLSVKVDRKSFVSHVKMISFTWPDSDLTLWQFYRLDPRVSSSSQKLRVYIEVLKSIGLKVRKRSLTFLAGGAGAVSAGAGVAAVAGSSCKESIFISHLSAAKAHQQHNSHKQIKLTLWAFAGIHFFRWCLSPSVDEAVDCSVSVSVMISPKRGGYLYNPRHRDRVQNVHVTLQSVKERGWLQSALCTRLD